MSSAAASFDCRAAWHQAHLVNRAKRYLAYFKAYTSTFCGSAGAAHVSTGGQPPVTGYASVRVRIASRSQ